MQRITSRFAKDLLVTMIFIACVYGIIHNPITRPKPNYAPGAWSVEALQHPLFLGLAGHNYLILRDDKGAIVAELHGLATDPETGTYKYFGTSRSDILKVWEFPSVRYSVDEYNYPGLVLAQGDETTIETFWNKAKECMNEINEKQIPYSMYGISIRGSTDNSNSAANTLTKCMGLRFRHIGIFTPGASTDLLRN